MCRSPCWHWDTTHQTGQRLEVTHTIQFTNRVRVLCVRVSPSSMGWLPLPSLLLFSQGFQSSLCQVFEIISYLLKYSAQLFTWTWITYGLRCYSFRFTLVFSSSTKPLSLLPFWVNTEEALPTKRSVEKAFNTDTGKSLSRLLTHTNSHTGQSCPNKSYLVIIYML